MKSLKLWFNNKFIPTMAKLGNQRHLASIRDAFAIFTPIIIAGALATLWRSAIFADGKGTLGGLWVSFNDYKAGGDYSEFLTVMKQWTLYIQVGTISVMSLYVSFGVGYFLAQSRGNNAPVIAGLASLAGFLSVTSLMIGGSWESGMYWIGARGLLAAILISLFTTEIYCWLSKDDKMAIKMPAGVPPAVSRSFAKLFPVMLSLLCAASISWIIWMGFFFSHAKLYEGVDKQLQLTLKTGATTISSDDFKFIASHSDHVAYTGMGFDPNVLNVNEISKNTLLGNGGFTLDKDGVFVKIAPHLLDKDGKIVTQGLSATQLGILHDNFNFVTAPATYAKNVVTVTTTSVNVDDLKNALPAKANLDALFFKSIKDAMKSTGSQLSYATSELKREALGGVTFTSFIYSGVVAPFLGLADNTGFAFGLAILYVLLVSFFWFFGLHGTNIVNGAFNPIWLILYAENVAGAHHVFVQGTFDAYIFIGGWGATLPLVIATLIFGKRDSAPYEVSKFALAPGIFNINEPVTFGYPLVLNGMLAIPLFLVMPILTVTTYAGIEWFNVPVVTVLIPWTTPVGFGGLIASASAWGFVLAFANMIIAALVWTPFVFLMRKADASAMTAAAEKTTEGKKVVAKKAAAAK